MKQKGWWFIKKHTEFTSSFVVVIFKLKSNPPMLMYVSWAQRARVCAGESRKQQVFSGTSVWCHRWCGCITFHQGTGGTRMWHVVSEFCPYLLTHKFNGRRFTVLTTRLSAQLRTRHHITRPKSILVAGIILNSRSLATIETSPWSPPSSHHLSAVPLRRRLPSSASGSCQWQLRSRPTSWLQFSKNIEPNSEWHCAS